MGRFIITKRENVCSNKPVNCRDCAVIIDGSRNEIIMGLNGETHTELFNRTYTDKMAVDCKTDGWCDDDIVFGQILDGDTLVIDTLMTTLEAVMRVMLKIKSNLYNQYKLQVFINASNELLHVSMINYK